MHPGQFLLRLTPRHLLPESRLSDALAWQLPILTILICILALTGIGVYKSVRHSITERTNENLAAIAMLKTGQIEHWLAERRDDALLVTRSSTFSANLRHWLLNGAHDGAQKDSLLRHLQELSSIHHYRTISIYSASNGTQLLTVGGGHDDQAHDRSEVLKAAQAEAPVLDDLHFPPDVKPSQIELGYFVPFIDDRYGKALAVAYLVADPAKLLFPVLQQQASSSPSAETLLVRVEGDNLVYLNNLRHHPSSTLQFRMPRSTPGLLAAQAAEGKTGAIQGIDYRNVPSLGHALPVPGTPWLLITKIDEEEVYAHINKMALFSALVMTLSLLVGLRWFIEHTRNTARIERLSRLYAAISKTNQAMIHSQSPPEVYRAVCNACVELGGLRLAWVGIADPLSQRILPVEAAGEAVAYLDDIVISTNPALAEGQGPSGQSFREQRMQQCADFLADPATLPWHARAAECGVHCSVSLPLQQAGQSIGTLCVYGSEKNFFDREALEILGEMAGNISFFLDLFAQEMQRSAHASHLQQLSRRIVAVQEEERRRLVRELHDSTSPNLATIKLILKTIQPVLEAAPSAAEISPLEDVLALLEDTTQNIREICGELRPPLLDYAGLVHALDGYIRQFGQRTGIAVQFNARDITGQFSPEIESSLFRIVQEALTNCAKHARASQVDIELSRQGEQVALRIVDNGTGFAPDKLGEPGYPPGFGLLTMRERAEFIGGTFEIITPPGRGTTITVHLQASEHAPGQPAILESNCPNAQVAKQADY
jgi:signal transduction histidine kinase